MNTTVYLCRHGTYENPLHILHGRLSGFPLSKEGQLQVRKLAEYLASKSISAIYSSSLARAYETAEIVARTLHLSVLSDPRLLDIKTPLEGRPLSEVAAMRGNFYEKRFIDRGGESLQNVFGRISSFVKEKLSQHKGREIVMVTHGDLIMSMRSMYLDGVLPIHYSYECGYVGEAKGYALTYDDQLQFVHLAPIPLMSGD